jgi:hypothetical protein
MKNYLVGAVRPSIKIWNPWAGKGDDLHSKAHAAAYLKMYNISRSSARKFLAGPYEEIMYRAPVLDARMFQIAQWYMIKELWFREPCNILVMGADTMFIRPTEIFGKFNEMRMFNYSDPKTHPDVEHNFNDDIRYYPSTMNPAVWEIGERHMEDWFVHEESAWACGQLIHNYMIWSQEILVDEMFQPQLAWQAISGDDQAGAAWNQCPLSEAHVLHFHGSRGSGERLNTMMTLSMALGLE